MKSNDHFLHSKPFAISCRPPHNRNRARNRNLLPVGLGVAPLRRSGPADYREHEIGFRARHSQLYCPRELSPEYIMPSVFNRGVVQRVAEAVKRAAIKAGVARKRN